MGWRQLWVALILPAGEADHVLGPDCDHQSEDSEGREEMWLRDPKTGLGLRRNFLT